MLPMISWAMLAAFPASAAVQEKPVLEEVRFHRVHLKNGNFVDGGLIRDTDKEVALKMKFGEMVFRRDLVDRVEFIKMRTVREPAQVLPPPKKTEPTEVKSPEPSRKEAPRVENPAALTQFPRVLRDEVDGLLGLDAKAVSLDDQLALVRRIQAIGLEAVPYLCALLENRADSVPIRLVCLALGEFRDPSAVPSLEKLMKSEDYPPRVAAIKALSTIATKECVPTCIEALNDGWSEVIMIAVKALVDLNLKFPDLKIPSTLVERMPKSRGKAFFAETLGRIGGDEVRAGLSDHLRSSDDVLVAAALQGLSVMVTEEDGPNVRPLLQSRNRGVMQTACVVLGKIKYKPAVPDLIEFLRSEDLGIVTTAHAALQAISGERLAADPATWKNWWDTAGSKP